MQIADVQWVQ